MPMLVPYVQLKWTSAACGNGLGREQQGKIFPMGGFHGKVVRDKSIYRIMSNWIGQLVKGLGRKRLEFSEKRVWARCMRMTTWCGT